VLKILILVTLHLAIRKEKSSFGTGELTRLFRRGKRMKKSAPLFCGILTNNLECCLLVGKAILKCGCNYFRYNMVYKSGNKFV
jgi:hypothetical protein